jgi:hypothetical protein
MPTFLGRFKFIFDYYFRGRLRKFPAVVPPDLNYPAPDAWLMAFAEDMFKSHGAYTYRSGSWIVVDEGRLFIRAAYFDLRRYTNDVVLQTDFVCVSSSGQHIVESFAGIGTDLKSALTDACKSFQDSSFHTLFVTFLDHPCDHVDRETWTISGRERSVTFGWLCIRGEMDTDFWPPIFGGLRKQLEVFYLSPGLHWIRCFYAHIPGDSPTIEVLLNNEPCEILQAQIADLPWPSCEKFYSARLFFTIRDASLTLIHTES